jgi:hypothetical protein
MQFITNNGQKKHTHLSGPWKHAFTRIQLRPTGFLDFFDFGPAFPDDRSHSGVGDDKFDSNGPAAGNGRHVKGFVIDSSNDKPKSL